MLPSPLAQGSVRGAARWGEALEDLVDDLAQGLLVEGGVSEEQAQVDGSVDAVEDEVRIGVGADLPARAGTVDDVPSRGPTGDCQPLRKAVARSSSCCASPSSATTSAPRCGSRNTRASATVCVTRSSRSEPESGKAMSASTAVRNASMRIAALWGHQR